MTGYPAETSGLQVGDEIVKVNEHSVSSWQDLTFKIMEQEGDALEFTFKRNGGSQTLAVKPQMDEGTDIFGQAKRRPRIGILPSTEFRTERYGLSKALLESAKLEWELVAITYKALWYLVTMRLSPRAISGPIGIISMGGSAAKMGIVSLLQFAAFISISLGVVNLLPIPALDGGHLFFLAIETVFRRPLNLRIQERFTQFGFYFLMALMVLVVFNDLVNIGALEKLKALF
jgi:regulator of sigma E protease